MTIKPEPLYVVVPEDGVVVPAATAVGAKATVKFSDLVVEPPYLDEMKPLTLPIRVVLRSRPY